MKIRKGFVSNSSSSSFIIANAQDKKGSCECCGRPFNAGLDMIQNLLESSSDVESSCDLKTNNKEELIDYLTEEWYYDKNEAFNLIKDLDVNKGILLGSVSYHNSTLNDLIFSNPKEIKVVYNFG